MDKQYIDEHTKEWSTIDSNGNLELCSYFDMVDWHEKYAIKRNGEVIYSFHDGEHGDNYNFFNAVAIIS